jgi:hypothetical protein
MVAWSVEAAPLSTYGAFEVFSIKYAINIGLGPLWWALIGGG